MDTELLNAQRAIIAALGVTAAFDAEAEIQRRVAFIAQTLRASGRDTLVLGISGGVDSLTAGRLCQLAVQHLRSTGETAQFLAIRLPYGEQHDASDAEAALGFIRPDQALRLDIQAAVDATMDELHAAGVAFANAQAADYVAGNVRARQRMIVQYAAANAANGLVVGTDHAAEAVMGFFTKHGDGACDLTPLAGLTKRRVRAVAAALGAPAPLVQKTPTADLESLRPLHPDETALGITYEVIDDFLEGRAVERTDAERIVATFHRTAHKRAAPLTPVGPG